MCTLLVIDKAALSARQHSVLRDRGALVVLRWLKAVRAAVCRPVLMRPAELPPVLRTPG